MFSSRSVLRAAAVSTVAFVFFLTSCADSVDVYYSSSLNGNLLGCDCWGYPEAGLDKRAWYLGENPPSESALLLDAGNVLETGRDPFLADLILQTYKELGYTAVAVGTHELAEGLDVLLERSGAEQSPVFLSNNLEIKNGPDSPAVPLSGKALIHQSGNNRIAVISLADPQWFEAYLPLFKGRLSVADPLEILKNRLEESSGEGANTAVILAHGSEKWIRQLMGEFSSDSIPIAAVILAGEERVLDVKLPGGVPLLSPGEEGNRLGILKLKLHRNRRPSWKNKFVEFHYLGPGDPVVAERGAVYAEYLDKKRVQ